MIRFYRGILLAGGILAAAGTLPALAQDNLDAGKTPAQLYAADCAICHKTPQGLNKGGGIFGLSGFLREHYTASREAASAIAAYVQSVDKGPAPAKKPGKRTAKGDDKSKSAKPNEAKPEQIKAGEPKSAVPKAEPKSPKADEKTGDAKPAESKTSGAKASEPKPAEPLVAEPKPTAKDPASEKKPD
jgi:hypothetical protein